MKIVKINILIICVVGFLLYFNSFFNGFVWDDEDQILGNTLVHSLSNLPKFFSGGSFGSGGLSQMTGAYYRPVMALTFSFIYSVFGASPFFFHFIQIVIITTSAIFLYLIFEKLFPNLSKSQLPLLLSLLFLVHPLISEVAFYAANMQDALFFLFGILYYYIFVIQGYSLRYKIIYILLPLACLMSKETGALFGLVSIIYSYLFDRNKLSKVLTHWSVAFGIYLFARLAIAGIGFGERNINIMFQISLFQRLFTIPKILLEAIKGSFLPFGYVLTLNQHWFVLTPDLTNFYLPAIIAVIFVSILIVGGIRLRDKSYWFFLIWFILGLTLHLQILPLDITFSGRFYYFSLVGLLGMIGCILSRVKSQRIVYWSMVIVIASFSIITFIRSFDFRNGLSLYTHDQKFQKDNYNLENNLGVELYRKGEIDKAATHFQKSIKLNSHWWTAYNNLGAYWEAKGEATKAAELYLTSINKGNYFLAIENYGKILYKQKRISELKEFLSKYLLYFPNNQLLNLLWQSVLESPNESLSQ